MTAQDPRAAFAADLRRHAAAVAMEQIDAESRKIVQAG